MSGKNPYEDWKNEALLEEFKNLAVTVAVGRYDGSPAYRLCREEILKRMVLLLAPERGM